MQAHTHLQIDAVCASIYDLPGLWLSLVAIANPGMSQGVPGDILRTLWRAWVDGAPQACSIPLLQQYNKIHWHRSLTHMNLCVPVADDGVRRRLFEENSHHHNLTVHVQQRRRQTTGSTTANHSNTTSYSKGIDAYVGLEIDEGGEGLASSRCPFPRSWCC